MTCKFWPAYSIKPCGIPTGSASDICEEHSKKKCDSCGESATHECSYTGQFVCGAPLCDKCVDRSKPSGAWGFMNHEHVRRSDSV